MNARPQTLAEAQDAVRSLARLRVRSGGSKPALSSPPDDVATLDLSALAGVIAYEPGEFVFTALAGTTVASVQNMLAGHGQHLPFDPLLAERGATLGGVVAANTAGPQRYRYGGVRDFLIGVRFVDGEGRLVRGGGKVVKNSAGFDLPKLMVGSLGRLGALVELSFKVFPQPVAFATLSVTFAGLTAAIETMCQISMASFDLEALDLEAPAGAAAPGPTLWLRIGGPASILPDRIARLQEFVEQANGQHTQLLDANAEPDYWRQQSELAWAPPGATVVKTPITPARIPTLDVRLPTAAQRRYSVGGNVAWIAWPHAPEDLDSLLKSIGLGGALILGRPGPALLGERKGLVFAQRVKQALDPLDRFA